MCLRVGPLGQANWGQFGPLFPVSAIGLGKAPPLHLRANRHALPSTALTWRTLASASPSSFRLRKYFSTSYDDSDEMRLRSMESLIFTFHRLSYLRVVDGERSAQPLLRQATIASLMVVVEFHLNSVSTIGAGFASCSDTNLASSRSAWRFVPRNRT